MRIYAYIFIQKICVYPWSLNWRCLWDSIHIFEYAWMVPTYVAIKDIRICLLCISAQQHGYAHARENHTFSCFFAGRLFKLPVFVTSYSTTLNVSPWWRLFTNKHAGCCFLVSWDKHAPNPARRRLIGRCEYRFSWWMLSPVRAKTPSFVMLAWQNVVHLATATRKNKCKSLSFSKLTSR